MPGPALIEIVVLGGADLQPEHNRCVRLEQAPPPSLRSQTVPAPSGGCAGLCPRILAGAGFLAPYWRGGFLGPSNPRSVPVPPHGCSAWTRRLKGPGPGAVSPVLGLDHAV